MSFGEWIEQGRDIYKVEGVWNWMGIALGFCEKVGIDGQITLLL